jgi:acetoin utilization deacetylase AcuC-like enzyme
MSEYFVTREKEKFAIFLSCRLHWMILSLLSQFSRVIFIDIDVHHGDEIEEALHSADILCKVLFHQFVFSETEGLKDICIGKGHNSLP